MKYQSTRGGFSGYSFEDALLSGYTPDGGILVPETVPHLSKETLQSWKSLSYPDLVKKICRLYMDETEMKTEVLNELLDRAFSSFTHPDVAVMKPLEDGLNILELFHGTTLAFKDLALSCIGQFIEHFLSKRKKHMTVIVGTSGDTGSAAIEAVKGLKWVDLVVLLPRGRCERIQELQMTTVIADNIHVFRVDGTSDDMDLIIKPFFMDAAFSSAHNLCSINSINWARIMVQIAHYFYAYLQVCPNCDSEVEIVIPTGACGNVTSGCFAQHMGLPIKLLCATNANDIVYRTLKNGDFSVNASVIPTIAPAMDIQIPYNMERIFHLFTNADSSRVKNMLEEFESKGGIQIEKELHDKIASRIGTWCVTDSAIQSTMRDCWDASGYLLCPHTATAANYCYVNDPRVKLRVCLATASPVKFVKAVTSAGLTPHVPDAIKKLYDAPTKYVDMNVGDDWSEMLREVILSISKRAQELGVCGV